MLFVNVYPRQCLQKKNNAIGQVVDTSSCQGFRVGGNEIIKVSLDPQPQGAGWTVGCMVTASRADALKGGNREQATELVSQLLEPHSSSSASSSPSSTSSISFFSVGSDGQRGIQGRVQSLLFRDAPLLLFVSLFQQSPPHFPQRSPVCVLLCLFWVFQERFLSATPLNGTMQPSVKLKLLVTLEFLKEDFTHACMYTQSHTVQIQLIRGSRPYGQHQASQLVM